MVCFPNCKINIGLYITSKRADGYHDISTVFYPVMYRDGLEVMEAVETTLHLSGNTVNGNPEDNLVMKAFRLLQNNYPSKVKETAIYLHKAIPMGAGLGGGSADGAFMLALINDYYQLGIDKNTLAAFALDLGSDCPFFIYNTPMVAAGRGEQMKDIKLSLAAYSLQVVYPEIHVSTKEAFSMLSPRAASFDLNKLAVLPVTDWKQHVSNDFEEPVFSKHSVLASIKEQLYGQGALYASMSGSGSALYGIFPRGVRAVINIPVLYKEFYQH